MEIRDRIRMIMTKENISSSVFAEKLGVQQSTLSHILNNRNKPSLDFIMKVHQRYGYVSLEWLLYGKGEMEIVPSYRVQGQLGMPQPSLFEPNQPMSGSLSYNNKKTEFQLADTQQSTVNNKTERVKESAKRILEIRVFFDDNTYEVFKSEKK